MEYFEFYCLIHKSLREKTFLRELLVLLKRKVGRFRK
jgi:hypothetical protein